MEIKQRYGQLLLILDTCQAATIGSLIVSPRVTTISSSARGENSYAYQSSPELGVPLIDRFTYAVSLFLQQNVMSNGLNQPVPLQRLINSLDPRFLHSTPILDQSQDSENPHNLDLREFLSRGSIADSGIGLKVVSEPVDTDGIESYDIFMAKRSREAEALVEPS
jgi:glycosylphosphatidylinositol transamidase (GPIT) subunit GPI8